MHIGEGPDPEPLIFNLCTVNFVSSFKYLGSTITKTGDVRPEINQRRAQAWAILQSLWEPLWRHRHITQQTKRCVYHSSVMSVLLYSSETWALNSTLEARLNGFDRRALRRITGTRWHERVSNKELPGVDQSTHCLVPRSDERGPLVRTCPLSSTRAPHLSHAGL
ncbi:Hypp8134 [Branchiostoma lanceolatum]|uniref:Hypp8134 protein n=1 Tax=Branchiostoma lanceolatum TaxID=7740 RepID=A0A8J9Z793_BRALA|nr:Hypp8134 [Branchiostoma lanceolatum]